MATPTPSSPGFRVVSIGTGKDYASLSAFANYLGTQNLVSNAEMLCAEVYENQTITGVTFGAISANNSYYCIIQSVPGSGPSDLDSTGPLDYGTSGIELTADCSSTSRVKNGVVFRNFRIHVTGSTAGSDAFQMTKSGQTSPSSSLQGFQRCRFLIDVTQAQRTISSGDSGGIFLAEDNLVIFGSSAPAWFAHGFDMTMNRSTFVRKGGTGKALGELYTSSVSNCVFANMGATAYQSSNSSNFTTCISDNGADNGKSGFVINTTQPFFQNAANDFRPATSGPLIAAASNTAANTSDVRNNNRGSSPDLGAAQLAVLPPGPTGTVTSQPTPDGQSVTVQFSTTGSPTSGSATLVPAATNPSGAVSTSGTVSLVTNAGTATFTSIPPGNYTVTITLTGAGGMGTVSGTQPVSINSISGTPEGDAGSGGTTPTVTQVSVTPNTATGSTIFTATVTGTNSPSQAVTWTATAGSISSSGVFTAPAATGSVQTITITATSAVDNTKSGTATVTIAAAGSTVTGVIVSPSTATVNGGATRQFSATASGTNSPSQAVSWTANGGSVSSTGLFTAPVATTSAQTFTVTATSVADGSKSGSATITVPALAAATRTVTMPLATGVDIFNQPIPAVNLSGLSVAIYAQSTPGSASTALYQTESGTTNGSGVFSASFQTLLQAGALVLVVILMPDGRHCASKVAIA